MNNSDLFAKPLLHSESLYSREIYNSQVRGELRGPDVQASEFKSPDPRPKDAGMVVGKHVTPALWEQR